MKIAIACDHAGYEYKERLVKYLREKGHEVKDFGTYSAESMDYPDCAGTWSLLLWRVSIIMRTWLDCLLVSLLTRKLKMW